MAKVKIAVISSSLKEQSRSRLAAQTMTEALEANGAEVDFIDLNHYDVQAYPRSHQTDTVNQLVQRFHEADGWVFAGPVYNWNVPASLSSFLHYALGESKRRYRPFVIIMAGGGEKAYLAFDGLARTIIDEETAVQIGPPILVTGETVDREAGIVSEKLQTRLAGIAPVLIHYARAGMALYQHK